MKLTPTLVCAAVGEVVSLYGITITAMALALTDVAKVTGSATAQAKLAVADAAGGLAAHPKLAALAHAAGQSALGSSVTEKVSSTFNTLIGTLAQITNMAHELAVSGLVVSVVAFALFSTIGLMEMRRSS